jgi:hypothetical protein
MCETDVGAYTRFKVFIEFRNILYRDLRDAIVAWSQPTSPLFEFDLRTSNLNHATQSTGIVVRDSIDHTMVTTISEPKVWSTIYCPTCTSSHRSNDCRKQEFARLKEHTVTHY